MKAETLIVGNKEYTFIPLDVFKRTVTLTKLQKYIIPITAALQKSGIEAGKSILDADLTEAAQVFAGIVDEKILDDVIFPLMLDSKLYSVEKKTFIKDKLTLVMAFEGHEMLDFFTVVFLILKENFAVFFPKLALLFGGRTEAPAEETTALPG